MLSLHSRYGGGEWQLFDMRDDPAERNDLYTALGQSAEIVALRARLERELR